MIRVVVLAPALAVRAGLRALLSEDVDIEVVAEAAVPADLEEGFDADVFVIVAASDPQLALDETLTESDPAPAALLLSDDPAASAALSALPLRAWGLLPLDASAEELLAAVHALHEGLLVGAPNLLRPLISHPLQVSAPAEDLVEELTPREIQVLELLSHGLANKQIALALEISDHTVKFHLSSIYTKLGVSNRAEAVALGIRLGLITL